ncbi:ABC transporter ATP-binding protein [Actinomadura sp. SCN-SB]|uniref:ABC transporter ATP-binding protein n=1 Tax=Actinomadura sp. SCN-SB TaxID=3373092 RepID=UPI003750E056
MNAPAPMLEIRGLTAGYGDATVLHDVSLSVPHGHAVALLGPNGAGKTTLLRVVSGLLAQRQGEVLLDGERITAAKPYQRARRGLCHIPEGHGIYPSLTVRENLVLHTWRKDERTAIARAVEHFPVLGQKLGRRAGELSGGQQQMLAVVRGYVADPRLVLVDEVSMGLAPNVVDQIFEFLNVIVRAGTSLLLVEQYVNRALEAADGVVILTKGTVVFDGAPSAIADDVFEHYLGSATVLR